MEVRALRVAWMPALAMEMVCCSMALDGDLVGEVYLVELVDGADAVVGEHEGVGFDDEFAGFFVLGHGGDRSTAEEALLEV